MDAVMKTEMLLNLANVLLAKAIHYSDEASIENLEKFKHDMYYGSLDNMHAEHELTRVRDHLKKYD